MTKVLLLGAGKIGRMISRFLTDSGDYEVTVADHDTVALERLAATTAVQTTVVNAAESDSLLAAMHGRDVV
ncbi:MAG TPA: saccharopine dehydrogenase, partial [Planctomycetaceae bacterium]|nr:saccharopine dehydrogenase [Planctomycetaceae bacterium]